MLLLSHGVTLDASDASLGSAIEGGPRVAAFVRLNSFLLRTRSACRGDVCAPGESPSRVQSDKAAYERQ